MIWALLLFDGLGILHPGIIVSFVVRSWDRDVVASQQTANMHRSRGSNTTLKAPKLPATLFLVGHLVVC